MHSLKFQIIRSLVKKNKKTKTKQKESPDLENAVHGQHLSIFLAM